MYLPDRFRNSNHEFSRRIIERHPLATVVAVQNGEAVINHIPMILIEGGRLIGHMARANPMWKQLDGAAVTAVFHGANSYINPVWYPEDDVPTWNYAVVHLRGRCRLIENYDGLIECLRRLASHMNQSESRPWKFWLPEDLRGEDVLPQKIVGFEIEIEEIRAKFKLSQNRAQDEIRGAIEGLKSDRNDEQSSAIADLMREISLKN